MWSVVTSVPRRIGSAGVSAAATGLEPMAQTSTARVTRDRQSRVIKTRASASSPQSLAGGGSEHDLEPLFDGFAPPKFAHPSEGGVWRLSCGFSGERFTVDDAPA